MEEIEQVKRLLERIYGEETGALALKRIVPIIEKYEIQKSKKETYFSQIQYLIENGRWSFLLDYFYGIFF